MSLDQDRNITLRGIRELSQRAGRLFRAAQREFICTASDQDTWSKPALEKEMRAAGEPLAQSEADGRWRPPPDLRTYKMFTAAALADPAHERHLVELLELAGSRVQVRICAAAPAHETIIIDRRVAILAGPPKQGVRTYTVVRSPDVINGILSLFWSTWENATDLAAYQRITAANGAGAGTPGAAHPSLDRQSREILRLLGDGLKDETAARLLGLSLRTYRRRVADLMTLLGAESRFQAGRRARELGLDG